MGGRGGLIYNDAIERAVAALGTLINGGDAAPLVGSFIVATAIRGGLSDDGCQINTLIAGEVATDVIEAFYRQLAGRLSPIIDVISPETAVAIEQALVDHCATLKKAVLGAL